MNCWPLRLKMQQHGYVASEIGAGGAGYIVAGTADGTVNWSCHTSTQMNTDLP
jgi:hypothetical protein